MWSAWWAFCNFSLSFCRPKHTQTRTWRRDFLEHNGDHRWLYAAAVHTLFHQRYFFSRLLGYSVLLKAHRTICGFLNILEWCPHDDVMRARIISIRDFSTTTGNMTESEAMMCKRHEWDEAREEGKSHEKSSRNASVTHIENVCGFGHDGIFEDSTGSALVDLFARHDGRFHSKKSITRRHSIQAVADFIYFLR